MQIEDSASFLGKLQKFLCYIKVLTSVD